MQTQLRTHILQALNLGPLKFDEIRQATDWPSAYQLIPAILTLKNDGKIRYNNRNRWQRTLCLPRLNPKPDSGL